jgi:hypothetical protein
VRHEQERSAAAWGYLKESGDTGMNFCGVCLAEDSRALRSLRCYKWGVGHKPPH